MESGFSDDHGNDADHAPTPNQMDLKVSVNVDRDHVTRKRDDPNSDNVLSCELAAFSKSASSMSPEAGSTEQSLRIPPGVIERTPSGRDSQGRKTPPRFIAITIKQLQSMRSKAHEHSSNRTQTTCDQERPERSPQHDCRSSDPSTLHRKDTTLKKNTKMGAGNENRGKITGVVTLKSLLEAKIRRNSLTQQPQRQKVQTGADPGKQTDCNPSSYALPKKKQSDKRMQEDEVESPSCVASVPVATRSVPHDMGVTPHIELRVECIATLVPTDSESLTPSAVHSMSTGNLASETSKMIDERIQGPKPLCPPKATIVLTPVTKRLCYSTMINKDRSSKDPGKFHRMLGSTNNPEGPTVILTLTVPAGSVTPRRNTGGNSQSSGAALKIPKPTAMSSSTPVKINNVTLTGDINEAAFNVWKSYVRRVYHEECGENSEYYMHKQWAGMSVADKSPFLHQVRNRLCPPVIVQPPDSSTNKSRTSSSGEVIITTTPKKKDPQPAVRRQVNVIPRLARTESDRSFVPNPASESEECDVPNELNRFIGMDHFPSKFPNESSNGTFRKMMRKPQDVLTDPESCVDIQFTQCLLSANRHDIDNWIAMKSNWRVIPEGLVDFLVEYDLRESAREVARDASVMRRIAMARRMAAREKDDEDNGKACKIETNRKHTGKKQQTYEDSLNTPEHRKEKHHEWTGVLNAEVGVNTETRPNRASSTPETRHRNMSDATLLPHVGQSTPGKSVPDDKSKSNGEASCLTMTGNVQEFSSPVPTSVNECCNTEIDNTRSVPTYSTASEDNPPSSAKMKNETSLYDDEHTRPAVRTAPRRSLFKNKILLDTIESPGTSTIKGINDTPERYNIENHSSIGEEIPVVPHDDHYFGDLDIIDDEQLWILQSSLFPPWQRVPVFMGTDETDDFFSDLDREIDGVKEGGNGKQIPPSEPMYRETEEEAAVSKLLEIVGEIKPNVTPEDDVNIQYMPHGARKAQDQIELNQVHSDSRPPSSDMRCTYGVANYAHGLCDMVQGLPTDKSDDITKWYKERGQIIAMTATSSSSSSSIGDPVLSGLVDKNFEDMSLAHIPVSGKGEIHTRDISSSSKPSPQCTAKTTKTIDGDKQIEICEIERWHEEIKPIIAIAVSSSSSSSSVKLEEGACTVRQEQSTRGPSQQEQRLASEATEWVEESCSEASISSAGSSSPTLYSAGKSSRQKKRKRRSVKQQNKTHHDRLMRDEVKASEIELMKKASPESLKKAEGEEVIHRNEPLRRSMRNKKRKSFEISEDASSSTNTRNYYLKLDELDEVASPHYPNEYVIAGESSGSFNTVVRRSSRKKRASTKYQTGEKYYLEKGAAQTEESDGCTKDARRRGRGRPRKKARTLI